MTKPSFAAQAGAITEAVAIISRLGEMSEPELSWLKQAGATLNALAGIEDLTRAMYVLNQQNPALANLLAAFPNARIADVRPLPGYEEPEFDLCGGGSSDDE